MNAPQPPSKSKAGYLVGEKYRLEERLGEGAAGAVYRAVHVGLEKPFAIKLLKTSGSPSRAALERFRTEAVALGRLRHPNIVEVTDSGIDEAPYLVMELLEGTPLSGPLPLEKALPLLDQVADAIDAAHGAGVLHRDLKPGNVLVSRTGQVKVLDFGLAELLTGPHRTSEALEEIGTPLYAAPEMIRNGEASRASDIYSFGVLAYEILGGRPPFRGAVAEVLRNHLEEEPPPLSLPREVWIALREALQKDPAFRPRTAGELVRRLRQGAAQAEWAGWKAREIPRRIRIAAFLATALAVGMILPWPLLPPVERRIGDWRVQTSPPNAPDPRILLITFDEASPESSPPSMADRGDEIGRTLSRVFEAGARNIAIDVLPPEKWSKSLSFSDLVLRHSDALTLAAFSDPDGSLVGPECLDRLTMAALGPRTSQIFGFVNLDEDRDGVIRRGRIWFRDRSGSDRLSWAARAARSTPATQGFWIDTRIDWSRYARISWWQVPAALRQSPGIFRNRLVLVGWGHQGSGDDYYRTAHAAVSSLTLQALMVDTILKDMPVREPAKMPSLVLLALAVALALSTILCSQRARPPILGLALAAGVYLAVSFPVFWWTGLMLPAATPLLLLLVGVLAALALRRILPSPPEVPAQ
ncbi:MAG TPA: protein kinase [Thermoanaerobaculia bacterium]|nr:protein kinase [Thermoanaerobaculia bacterium]